MKFRRKFHYLLLAATVLILIGARPTCRPPATLDCESLHVTVLPGTCVDIQNPCSMDGSWTEGDHFRLYQEPEGLYVRGTNNNGVLERQICADESVGEYTDEPVSYTYTKMSPYHHPDYGEATIYVTTVPEEPQLAAEVTASPAAIEIGDSTRLAVTAVDGTPPYSYYWLSDPTGSFDLGDANNDTLWAKPVVTTKYWATVWDNDANTDTDTVTVTVGLHASFTMDPDTINVGDTSQFTAVVVGGRQPFEYSWVPFSRLDNSTIPNPRAFPLNTQIHELTVVDADAIMVSYIDTLFVRLEADAGASPTEIPLGDSALLTASWEGGAAPYAYSWSPAGTVDEPTGSVYEMTASTYARPTDNTTYVVTITDRHGQQAVDSVDITVTGGTTLDACFTWEPEDPPDVNDGEIVNFHPQCSQGNIVAWVWWFGFDEGEPGPYSDSLSHERSQDIMFYTGTYIIRLKVYDDQGNSDDMLDTINVLP